MTINELEYYFVKNIIDLMNCLQLEFFNLLCIYIPLDIITAMCNKTNILPIVRKALVCLYSKYNFGNCFKLFDTNPKNKNDLINFDRKEVRCKRSKSEISCADFSPVTF